MLPLALITNPPEKSPAIVLACVILPVASGMGEPVGAVVGAVVGRGDGEPVVVRASAIETAAAVIEVLHVPLAGVMDA